MKNVVAIILIFLLTLQAFSPLVIYSCYYANKSYVIETLCENRNKPQLHCDGKCFLQKQLRQSEGDKEDVRVVEAFVYITPAPPVNLRVNYRLAQRHYPSFPADNYAYNYRFSCFHPPCI